MTEDAFGQRQIEDLIGEALRRHRYGNIRPLWRDMQEKDRVPWRARAGRTLLYVDAAIAAGGV